MLVSGPQRGLFLACLATGVACLVVLDAVFVPGLDGPEPTPADAGAPFEAAVASTVPSAAPSQASVPAAARVPTIVARFDSAVTEPADEMAIRALARAMIEDHASAIVLEGHSDTIGGDDYNHEISLARAEWVKGRLVQLGVTAERVETVGLGATRPLHSDVDAQASVNRRVEVRWK